MFTYYPRIVRNVRGACYFKKKKGTPEAPPAKCTALATSSKEKRGRKIFVVFVEVRNKKYIISQIFYL
jgi:hypothetical protein